MTGHRQGQERARRMCLYLAAVTESCIGVVHLLLQDLHSRIIVHASVNLELSVVGAHA